VQSDASLSLPGAALPRALASWLPTLEFSTVVPADLSHATKAAAEIVAAYPQVKLRLDPHPREVAHGEDVGQRHGACRSGARWQSG
jgi:hypothetical protein